MPKLFPPLTRRCPLGRLQRAVASLSDFLRHMRRRWYLYLPVFAIWGLAYAWLFVDPTPRVPVVFNWTPSLPYRVALVHAVPANLHRGDYIVFAFAGDEIGRAHV